MCVEPDMNVVSVLAWPIVGDWLFVGTSTRRFTTATKRLWTVQGAYREDMTISN